MKNRKRPFRIVACICAAVFASVGCSEVTELTDKEEDMIAEYAATTLLSFDKGYKSRFDEDAILEAKRVAKENAAKRENAPTETPKPEESEEPTATPEPTQAPTEAPSTAEPEQTAAPTQEPTEAPAATPDTRMSAYDIGKKFGIEGIEVNYIGFEALDSYPVIPDEQLAFTMEASQGAKLIVAKFELLNVTDSAKNCNIVGQNIKFQMRFNQTDNVAVQRTLLNDDFALLNCVLQPGEAKQVVVICQVAAGYETTISSVDMIVRIGGENTLLHLQ